MYYRQLKYSLSGLIVATTYWLFDSSIHYFFYEEAEFEFIPSTVNELWMRTIIFILVIGFGIYVDISVKRMKKLFDDKYQLQLKLDQTLTKLVGGFVPICCVCKKVAPKAEQRDTESAWENIDSYIARNTAMEFSHGYCPECEKEQLKSVKK